MISRLRHKPYSLVRIPTAGYILGTMLLLLTYSTPADATNVVIEYREAKSTDLKKIRTTLIEARLLENYATALKSGVYPFQNTLTLVTDQCGREMAYYRSKTKTITLCYEIVRRVIEKAEKENGGTDQMRELFWGGAISFVLLHEIGHALFDLLNLDFVGHEEDVADQFATDLALSGTLEIQKWVIIGGMWFFERKGNEPYSKEEFANEHSLDEQRYYNVMCWAYGKDSSQYAFLKKFLTDDRAPGCGDEYKKMRKGLIALGRQVGGLQGMSAETNLSTQQATTHFSPFPLVVNQVYKHPNYPTLVFGFDGQTFFGIQQSMPVPLATLELSSLPDGQWVSVPSIDQRQLPVMIMRRGYSLTAQWLP